MERNNRFVENQPNKDQMMLVENTFAATFDCYNQSCFAMQFLATSEESEALIEIL
jgi:hypothetical protein